MIDAARICTYELLKSRAPESINIGLNVISDCQDRKWNRSSDVYSGLNFCNFFIIKKALRCNVVLKTTLVCDKVNFRIHSSNTSAVKS